jgi:RNA polymerase sigma-70 factor (ECF subfamily)
MEESLNQLLHQNQTLDTGESDRVQEAAWVSASQSGDALAFNRLVLRWEKPIFNLSLRMLQDREEAAEATQEVFCSAFRNIGRFRRDAKFSTWIFRIAVNHCITRLRRRPPGIHLSMDDQRPGSPLKGWSPSLESHEKEMLREEDRRRVRQAMEKLPADHRVVVELKFYQELTFEDISEVIEAPLSTIKSRFYAGLEMLKLRLGSAE